MIEFVTNRRVLLGENTIKEVPGLMSWYGRKKAMLCVFNAQAPCVKTIEEALKQVGMGYMVYDKVIVEPDLEVIDEGVKLCRENDCDCVIAVGGGSVIDTAKTISMIATNGGETEEYQLAGREVKKVPLLFIAVATTAGTGAEATKVSVVYNKKKGFKKALYHNSMIAEIAILDPLTTVGLPQKVTVSTGMDAITHAIESYVSNNANDISRMYSLKAVSILADTICEVVKDPTNPALREKMLLGSYLAGCAISAGTTLAHIVGQPVGAIFKIPHGDSCTIFLVPSMRLNLDYCTAGYADVARAMGIDCTGMNDRQAAEAGIDRLEEICREINAPTSLAQYVDKKDFDMESVLDNIQTSMGHIKTNPRPASRELFRELLEKVW